MSHQTDSSRSHSALDSVGPLNDQRRLRDTLSAFATGVTVVTVGGASPHGMTANAFTSLSLDPPLVLLCVNHHARLHEVLTAAGEFAVSVLAAHQKGVARYFTDRKRPEGLAQFAAVSWAAGPQTGAPLINGALAWLECSLEEVYDGGDHSIFVGRLVSITGQEQSRPLVFYGGRFHQLGGEVHDDSESQ